MAGKDQMEFDPAEEKVLDRLRGQSFDHNKAFLKQFLHGLTEREVSFARNIVGHYHRSIWNSKNNDIEETTCSICGGDHGTQECHEQMRPIFERKILVSKARQTLPSELFLTSDSGSLMVQTMIVIPKGSLLGVMEAQKRFKHTPESSYILRVVDHRGQAYYLDHSDENETNWIKFIAFVADSRLANIECYLYEEKIHYVSIKEINFGESLLVTYSACYSAYLKSVLPRAEAVTIPEHRGVAVDLMPVQPVVQPDIKSWFTVFKKRNIVCLDCEFVSWRRPWLKKCSEELAIVAICDFDGKPLYKSKVNHPPGFLVNNFTLKANGIKRNDLVHAPKKDKVLAEVQKILRGKLVIGHGLKKDVEKCDLKMGDLECFDLQWHWWRNQKVGSAVTCDVRGCIDDVETEYKLKALYKKFFNEDIQTGHHDPMEDAVATMRIFRETYVPMALKNLLKDKMNGKPTNNIDPLREKK